MVLVSSPPLYSSFSNLHTEKLVKGLPGDEANSALCMKLMCNLNILLTDISRLVGDHVFVVVDSCERNVLVLNWRHTKEFLKEDNQFLLDKSDDGSKNNNSEHGG